jgi:hypothetical protein
MAEMNRDIILLAVAKFRPSVLPLRLVFVERQSHGKSEVVAEKPVPVPLGSTEIPSVLSASKTTALVTAQSFEEGKFS